MSLAERIKDCLGRDLIEITEFRGDVCAEIPKNRVIEAMTALKEKAGFDFLSDVLGVDNMDLYAAKAKKAKKKKGDEEGEEPTKEGPPPPRFEVIYLLLSLKTNERLQVKVRVPEDNMKVPSVTGLWKSANWPEREAFDMYGFEFTGHPNLRRLLMWDEFKDHPLRKDYPLEGKGEERHLNYDTV